MKILLLWRAIRPFSFPATIIPVSVGAVGIGTEYFNFILYLGTLMSGLLIHSATNLTNDYYDYRKGLDTVSSFGSSKLLPLKVLSPKEIQRLIKVFFGLALFSGFLLSAASNWKVMLIIVVGVIGGYAYTGPPVQLKYRALGLPMVFLMMGPLMVLGSNYAQNRPMNLELILMSIPIGLLVTAILHANDIRDRKWDDKHGVKTLAILMPFYWSKVLYGTLIMLAFISVLLLVILLNILPVAAISVLLLLPYAVRLYRRVSRDLPEEILHIDTQTAVFHFLFGLFIWVSLLIT